MGTLIDNLGRGALANLQQFVRKPGQGTEFRELCAAPLAPEHLHLLELDKNRIMCACDPCSILFVDSARQRFRRISRDIRRLNDFRMDDQEWDSLAIPIKLAFFAYSSTAARIVARYPSPGGAMESSLDLEYWDAIVERNPVLKKFAPDVEALLVNRIANPPQYYCVPIDQCYRLVGTMRTHWRGLSGGSAVWQQIDNFFQQLNQASEGTVPDLRFQIEGVSATPNAVTPQLSFKLRITNVEPEPIHSIALRAQIQIEPVRRRYTVAEQEHLKELFGEPERWSTSLHPLLWTTANINVPGFSATISVDVPAPCTFDFNVAMTQYIYGLEDGELPVSFLFSGTVFHAGRAGLQIAQIPGTAKPVIAFRCASGKK